MIGNAIAAGYLVLSLPFSAVGILRPKATGLRLLLLIFDTVNSNIHGLYLTFSFFS